MDGWEDRRMDVSTDELMVEDRRMDGRTNCWLAGWVEG